MDRYHILCLVLALFLPGYFYAQTTDETAPYKNKKQGYETQEKTISDEKPDGSTSEKKQPDSKKQIKTKADPQDELVGPEDVYRTPRAGKSLKGSLLGLDFTVPARDRDKTTALTVGAAIYSPNVGNEDVMPFAAFYHTNTWEEKNRRFRAVLAIFVNYLNFYDSTWNDSGFEFAASWENNTIPFPSSLIIENTTMEDSEIYWGYLRGGIGLGWRTRIAPYEIDSNFSIHVFYEPGLLYFEDTDNTAKNYILPPTTYEDRLHVMVRCDAMERNIMELRHDGWAAGLDFIRGHRYKWSDHDYNESFSKSDTETYYIFSGYATWAGGPSFLSERHRFILSVYGGFSPGTALDRYSAPAFGGGPSGDEADSLSRCTLPGYKFDEFLVSRYLLFTLEYRFELLFFMYLHIKGAIGPVRRMELVKNKTEVSISKDEAVGSVGAALTMGLPWDCQLYFEYVHDWGILRGKENATGDSFLISLSKAF